MSADQAEPLRRQTRRKHHPLVEKKQEPKQAWKIAVTSGKGGVGKSNVSLNLAIALGRLGKRVLLVDADTNLANIDILMGVHVKQTLSDVIFGKAYFSDVILNGPEGIKILPGSSGVVEVLEQDAKIRDGLIEAFEEFERIYDIIVIDTGAGLTENVLQFVTSVDDVVLVTNSEPTSITDAYAMIKMTVMRNSNQRISVLINLASKQKDALETFEKLKLAVRNFLNVEIQMLGFLPVDPNIPLAVARREPFLSLFPRSAATTSMVMMARKLLKLPTDSSDGGNLLKRIFQTKGAD